eukprot:1084546-Prorocentrum_minimum.AAC.2
MAAVKIIHARTANHRAYPQQITSNKCIHENQLGCPPSSLPPDLPALCHPCPLLYLGPESGGGQLAGGGGRSSEVKARKPFSCQRQSQSLLVVSVEISTVVAEATGVGREDVTASAAASKARVRIKLYSFSG